MEPSKASLLNVNPKITLMKKLLYVSLAAALVALLSFPSCSKGPKGDTGPAGPDSVFHSPWLTLNMSDSVETGLNDTVAVQNVFAPAITQSIIDGGMILTYIGVPDNNGNVVEEENAGENMEVTISVGAIYLRSFIDFSTYDFRYVVIPGTIVAQIESTTGMSQTQIRNMSYSDLNKALGNTLSVKTN